MAGAVNDRISRKAVMIGADLVRAAIVTGMLLVRTADMVWLVWPLLLLETLGAAFFEPARNAVIPNIVPPGSEIVANTLSSTTWSFNLAVGSSLGGLVAALLGRDAVFVLNALSFLISAALIRRMRFDEPQHRGHSRVPRVRTVRLRAVRGGSALYRRRPEVGRDGTRQDRQRVHGREQRDPAPSWGRASSRPVSAAWIRAAPECSA